MLYLLDANVLITANAQYYAINAVPEFWSWLAHKGNNGEIKIPIENFEEVTEGRTDDPLYKWITDQANKTSILLNEEADPVLVERVLTNGYAPDLTDDEIEQIGRDPFLIAYALADLSGRCVVTTEASKPSRRRHNRHIPDVCASLGVPCCNTFTMLKALSFSTKWTP